MVIRSISGGSPDHFGSGRSRQMGGLAITHNSPLLIIESEIHRIMRIRGELKQYGDLITEIEAFQLTGMKNRDNFNLMYSEYLAKHEFGDPQSYLESFHDELVIQVWTTLNRFIKGVLSQTNRAIVQRLIGDNLSILTKIETETRAEIFKILESEIGTLFQYNYPPKPTR